MTEQAMGRAQKTARDAARRAEGGTGKGRGRPTGTGPAGIGWAPGRAGLRILLLGFWLNDNSTTGGKSYTNGTQMVYKSGRKRASGEKGSNFFQKGSRFGKKSATFCDPAKPVKSRVRGKR